VGQPGEGAHRPDRPSRRGQHRHVGYWRRAGIYGIATATIAIWWYNGPATECCWRTREALESRPTKRTKRIESSLRTPNECAERLIAGEQRNDTPSLRPGWAAQTITWLKYNRLNPLTI
jgi:hypothetical protein